MCVMELQMPQIVYQTNVTTNMANTISASVTSTVSINSNNKKVRHKMDCYILHIILLVIILLITILLFTIIMQNIGQNNSIRYLKSQKTHIAYVFFLIVIQKSKLIHMILKPWKRH